LVCQSGRYHLHFTPTCGSWLNQVERWFALLAQRQIKRGMHRSVRELESDQGLHPSPQPQPQAFQWVKSRTTMATSSRVQSTVKDSRCRFLQPLRKSSISIKSEEGERLRAYRIQTAKKPETREKRVRSIPAVLARDERFD
jgi:hypothetical protein